MPFKTYGKRRRGYARARHQLQIGTHRSLQQVSLLKRMTDRFLARFETGGGKVAGSSGRQADRHLIWAKCGVRPWQNAGHEICKCADRRHISLHFVHL